MTKPFNQVVDIGDNNQGKINRRLKALGLDEIFLVFNTAVEVDIYAAEEKYPGADIFDLLVYLIEGDTDA